MFKKKLLCAILAAVMALCVLVTGCSTPAVAATIDGVDYTTGEYLANLYNTAYYTINNSVLIYYLQYGYDIWSQTMPYGEGDNAEKLGLSDYLVRITQDNMVRIEAAKNLLEQFGLELDQEEIDEINAEIDAIDEAALIEVGFSREAYRKTIINTSLVEQTLLYGLYDKDGARAMSEEEIRAYFDENYLSYKILEFSELDSEGKMLAEDELAAIDEKLNNYKAFYETNASSMTPSEAFDVMLKKYEQDNKTATTEEPEETEEPATSAEPATTTEEPVDENRIDIDAKLNGDEDLANAIKKVEVGKVGIVEYKKNGSTETKALILRLDPEEGKSETYFDDCRKNIIYGAKYDEYDELVKAEVAKISYSFNSKAVKMCRPESFFEG